MKPLFLTGDDMFVVVTYDVHSKRCAKVMKYLRTWLEHRQRSVFSGFLTKSQVEMMKVGLFKIIKTDYDNVIVFQSNKANQITEWNTRRSDEIRRTGVIHEESNAAKARERTATIKKRQEMMEEDGAVPSFRMRERREWET